MPLPNDETHGRHTHSVQPSVKPCVNHFVRLGFNYNISSLGFLFHGATILKRHWCVLVESSGWPVIAVIALWENVVRMRMGSSFVDDIRSGFRLGFDSYLRLLSRPGRVIDQGHCR